MSGESKFGTLDRAGILKALDETAEHLAEEQHPQEQVFVVGGAWMALNGLRDSTTDVDTLSTRPHALSDSTIRACESGCHRRITSL